MRRSPFQQNDCCEHLGLRSRPPHVLEHPHMVKLVQLSNIKRTVRAVRRRPPAASGSSLTVAHGSDLTLTDAIAARAAVRKFSACFKRLAAANSATRNSLLRARATSPFCWGARGWKSSVLQAPALGSCNCSARLRSKCRPHESALIGTYRPV